MRYCKVNILNQDRRITMPRCTSCNRIISNTLGWLLEVFGIKRSKAPDKIIPESIIQSNDPSILSGLLDGLFSTDGNMYLKKNDHKRRYLSLQWPRNANNP